MSMSTSTSSEKDTKLKLYHTIETIFQDFSSPGPNGTNFFHELCSEKLVLLLEELDTYSGFLLSTKIADKIVARYFDLKDFKDPTDSIKDKQLRWKLDMLHLVFKTALVLYAAEQPEWLEDKDVQLCKDKEELICDHPFLSSLDKPEGQKELNYLLKFLNYLRVAMPIIPASSNKHLLLKILERVEGSGMHYVTGGAMKPVARRRMTLIEEEGNAPAIKRFNRKKRGQKRLKTESGNGKAPKRPALERQCSLEPLINAVTHIIENSTDSLDELDSQSPTESFSTSFSCGYETSLCEASSSYESRSSSLFDEEASINFVPLPALLSREVSCSISVDFENVVPVDSSALPNDKDSKQNSVLWNLMNAIDVKKSEIDSISGTELADSTLKTTTLCATSYELVSDVESLLDNSEELMIPSIKISKPKKSKMTGIITGTKTGKVSLAGLKPTKLLREHSLFSPDLST